MLFWSFASRRCFKPCYGAALLMLALSAPATAQLRLEHQYPQVQPTPVVPQPTPPPAFCKPGQICLVQPPGVTVDRLGKDELQIWGLQQEVKQLQAQTAALQAQLAGMAALQAAFNQLQAQFARHTHTTTTTTFGQRRLVDLFDVQNHESQRTETIAITYDPCNTLGSAPPYCNNIPNETTTTTTSPPKY